MLQGACEMTWAKGMLFLALALGCFMPAAHAATYSGGTGVEGDPYLISTPADLVTLSNVANSADWSMQFLMTNDIDMSAVTGFTPIGVLNTPFSGVFDGGGHAVQNLTINPPTRDKVGFFGLSGSSSQIKNLGIENYTISSNTVVGELIGGLIGDNSGAVTACYATGAVTDDSNFGVIGGLIGLNEGTVTSCYATGEVTDDSNFGVIGGLIGDNLGTVTSCYAMGEVTGCQYAGGLIGYNQGTVTACYATGEVTSNSGIGMIGGLMGDNSGTVTACYATGAVTGNGGIGMMGGLMGDNSGTVTACYATGAVTGDNNSGGLIGKNEGTVTACYATGAVTDNGGVGMIGGLMGDNSGAVTACYATGEVTGGGELSCQVGGLIGKNEGAVTACYATGEVTGGGFVGGLIGSNSGRINTSFWDMDLTRRPGSSGGKGLTSAQMKSLSIFRNAGWSVYPDWVMTEGQCSRLAWESTGMLPIPAPESFPLPGSGTPLAPYRVSTPAEFALLSWHASILNAHIVLTQNLNMAEVVLHPIGDLGLFTGVLDGAGHALSNAELEYPESDGVGVFACVGTMGVVKDLGVVDAAISGRKTVGGLSGKNLGTVTSCYATGAVTGGDVVGGLVAENSGTVTSCCAMGAVTGENCVGGLVAENSGPVTSCYAMGAVTGNYAGGLIGINFWATVTLCCATGAVTGGSSVGGLVGSNRGTGGLVTSCYATGAATGGDVVGGLIGDNFGSVTSCYATGAVTGDVNIGGLVGQSNEGTETLSFWDMQTGGPNNGFGTGLPTEQMKQRATFESAGWNFSSSPPTWFIAEGQSYPQIFGIPVPINSIAALQALSVMGNGSYFLTQDLDAGVTADWGAKSANPGFVPIGTQAQPFNGTLDGKGHRITGLHIYRPAQNGAGLFGYLGATGVVRGLGLEDANITGANQVAGIAGVNSGTVEQCYARGAITGIHGVGGLVGENGGEVRESYAAAALTGSALGGLIGLDNGGSVSTSFWDMAVSGTTVSGGGMGLTPEAMRNSATYRNMGWDFVNTWGIADSYSYPYFQNGSTVSVVSGPPRLINSDAVDIVVKAFLPGLFVTVGGGAYPAYANMKNAGQTSITVALKQESINTITVSSISETGIETVIARYDVFESSQFPSIATAVASLTLTPDSPSLAAGTTQQFACTATFADGTAGDITPTASWNTNGGAITVAGFYTHGSGMSGTVQALLHTEQGWQYSNTATITTTKSMGGEKAGTGQVSGVVRSTYTGLGLPAAHVTSYNLLNTMVSGQCPVQDTLGNYAFFMPEGKYHFEGSCVGFRSELMRGGYLLESRTLITPGPPATYSEAYYSGQVKAARPLTYDYSLSPNDTGAPWVVFIEPVANTTVNTPNVVVTAIDADQYSELALAKYAHNTQEYDIPNKISSTGFYRDTWALKLGVNVLHLSTMDTEGNASEKTIQITYDPDYTGPGGDSDGDGMPNAWETAHGLNPNSATGVNGAEGDLDGDGLTNLDEYRRGTLPNAARSDADTLADGVEAGRGTNPLAADTDGDGLNDDVEIQSGSDPLRDDRIKTAITNLASGASVRGDAVTLVADVLPGYNPGAVASVSFEARGTGTGGAWRVIGAAASPPFATAWNASSFTPGAYQLRAVATSRPGCVDASPPAVSVTVSLTAPYHERIEAGVHTLSAPVSAATATTLALRDGARFARITIPAGALAANDTLSAFFPDAAGFAPDLSVMQRDAQLYLDLHLTSHTGPFLNGKRATLEVAYPDADRDDHLDAAPGLRVPMLSLNYLPAPDAAFVALAASSLNRATSCVAGETTHFSTFGVIEEQPAPPLNLLTTTLPQGTVGADYTAALDADGGAEPYTWTLSSGALPAGLNIVNSTLLGNSLTGAPTTPGNYTFTLQVADHQAAPYTASRSFTVGVFAAELPTVSITRQLLPAPQPGLANTLPAKWDITFTAAVSGFTTSGVTLTGTAATGATFNVTGSGAAYILEVTGVTRDGTLHPTVPAYASTAEEEVWLDRRKPQVAITSAAPGLLQSGGSGPLLVTALPVAFTLTFDEIVTGLAPEDFTFAGNPAGLACAVTGSGKSYTLLVTGATGPVALTPSLIAGAAADSAGNGVLATAYAGREVQYAPITLPTVTINQGAAPTVDPAKAFPITFDIVFSADVTGFATGDVAYIGAAPNPQFAVSGGDANYTLTVTGADGDGRIAFRIPENVVDGGNAASTSLDNVVTYDATPPGIVIGPPSTAMTRQGPVSYTVQYAGASAITLGAGDITLDTGAITLTETPSVTVTPGANPQARIVTLSNLSGLGTLRFGIAADTAVDAAGNYALAAGPSAAFGVDPRLTVTVNQAPGQRDPTNRLPVFFDVVFVDEVGGFDPEDVILDGAAPGAVVEITGSGAHYTVAVSGMADPCMITPRLAAGACPGVWGGVSEASTSTDNTVRYDPRLALAQFSATPTTGAMPLTVQFTDESQLGTAPIDDWYWDFGDGETSHEQHPKHVYTALGEYTVTLTVTTVAGEDLFTREDYIEVDVAIPALNWMGLALLAAVLAAAGCLCYSNRHGKRPDPG